MGRYVGIRPPAGVAWHERLLRFAFSNPRQGTSERSLHWIPFRHASGYWVVAQGIRPWPAWALKWARLSALQATNPGALLLPTSDHCCISWSSGNPDRILHHVQQCARYQKGDLPAIKTTSGIPSRPFNILLNTFRFCPSTSLPYSSLDLHYNAYLSVIAFPQLRCFSGTPLLFLKNLIFLCHGCTSPLSLPLWYFTTPSLLCILYFYSWPPPLIRSCPIPPFCIAFGYLFYVIYSSFTLL